MERTLSSVAGDVFLGLGSNVGDRAANLRAAAAALAAAGVGVIACSSQYETAPQGDNKDQPDFLNAVLRVRTDLNPLALLDLCKQLERDLGREPDSPRHGPRPIDIDVLLMGDQTLEHPRMRLPHGEIATRRFVLAPLLELDPDLTLPDGNRADALLAAVVDQPVNRRGKF